MGGVKEMDSGGRGGWCRKEGCKGERCMGEVEEGKGGVGEYGKVVVRDDEECVCERKDRMLCGVNGGNVRGE